MRYLLPLLACLTVATLSIAELPPGVVDTQPNGDTPPAPLESLAKITVPEGFHVTLFAGEPDVYQPIAMEFDDRGRLWVVENFSYPDWQSKDRDRILIFEDNDNDGRFDERKVFAENLSNITGIALGFGGVWCCSSPNFIFIPDRDQDDVPDGPAEIKLDGWNDESDEIEHNVFNGMTWGPDGWMYGSHGILADSFVGKPGTPKEKRLQINCGIWRYHPVTERVEVFAHGTTNPWGIDFDEYGQGFFTNCVIGHLWHLIPGARYERMYGTHFNPYAYALIDACSDHLHWGGGSWTDSRGGKGTHSEAGGGHAHVGAMIYRGGTWPEEYHGSMFTANLHGNRLNRDTLQRHGSGYVAKHAPDFFHGNDPWLRGIVVKYGPDGNVYVSDWTDLGECHDGDGTHRSSGRIYKITYGDSEPIEHPDLSMLSNSDLLAFAIHNNAWYWHQARRLLHERAVRGDDMTNVHQQARSQLGASEPSRRLKMLNVLALTGGIDKPQVRTLLSSDEEHTQSWSLRQLSDVHGMDNQTFKQIMQILPSASPKVKLEVASLLQKVRRSDKRLMVAEALLKNYPKEDDPNLLSMTWLAIESLATPRDMPLFVRLALHGQDNVQLAPFRQFIARRALAENPTDQRTIRMVLNVAEKSSTESSIHLLRGMRAAMKVGGPSQMPTKWKAVRERIGEVDDFETQRVLDELAIKFHDKAAILRLRQLALNKRGDTESRQNAIEILAENRVDGILPIMLGLLNQPRVRMSVISSMSVFNDPAVPSALVGRYSEFSPEEKQSAIAALTGSRQYARSLLRAVAEGDIPATAIKPAQAVEIYQLRDNQLRSQLKEHWGDLRSSDREKRQKIADWKAVLGQKTLPKADLTNGAKVYEENCGNCHKLFGSGGEIGPDLTGSDRKNLDYVLQNVVTPSAAVGKDYRLQTVVMTNGLTVTGALREQTPAEVIVQTSEKKVSIPRNQIDRIEATDLSLMPEGQFDKMTKEAVRDLVAYLASDPK